MNVKGFFVNNLDDPTAGKAYQPALIGVVLLFFFFQQIRDYDIWFYMIVGREAVALGAIPATMFYLLPLLGEPTNYIEWGIGLAHYLAYDAAGYLGMALLNSALGASALMFAYAAALGKRSWLHPGALLALAIVAYVFRLRVEYRAETVLFLAMGITLWALERYMLRGQWRQLIPIPIAAFFLIQAHPSVLFLLPLIGAYGLAALRNPPPGASPGKVVVTMVGCGVVALLFASINPYGWHQVFLPIISMSTNKEQIAVTSEYIPVMATAFRYPFLLLATLALPAVLFGTPHRISSGILVLVFGVLAFLYARNIGLFALVCLSPLVRLALRVTPQNFSKWRGRLASALVLTFLMAWPVWQGSWGYGLAPQTFPEKAVSYLRTNLPTARVFNFWDYGGYLAWALAPQGMVFVDGHETKTTIAVEYHDVVFRTDPGWQTVLDFYGIDAIFTPTLMNVSGRLIQLVVALAEDDNWQLVSVEPAGLLFVRSALLQTAALDKREIWHQILREAQWVLATYPDQPEPKRAQALARQALAETGQNPHLNSDALQ